MLNCVVTVCHWQLSCSESGEIEDEITDLIQHIQRVHCLENKGCICYAANENRVCTAVMRCHYIVCYIFNFRLFLETTLFSCVKCPGSEFPLTTL